MYKNFLLILVAGYVVYKIGWVDGFTAVNLFLVLCLAIVAAATLIRHSAAGKKLEEKRREAAREYEEKQKEK